MASIAQSWNQFRTFLVEVKAEVNKVTFPQRPEVISTTTVVILASVIFSIFLWFSDVVILAIYEGILRLFGAA